MSKYRVVIINGAPRSGKDTFIKYAKKCCDINEYAYVSSISTIDPIKDMLSELGWDGNKTEGSRKMLSMMKEFWVEECNDGPTRYVIDEIAKEIRCNSRNNDIIWFIQIREPYEINKLKEILKSFGYLYSISVSTLIIRSTEAEGKIQSNSSDRDVLHYEYDERIRNEGTLDQLRDKAYEYIENLLKIY